MRRWLCFALPNLFGGQKVPHDEDMPERVELPRCKESFVPLPTNEHVTCSAAADL
jgi:hypothetical protein